MLRSLETSYGNILSTGPESSVLRLSSTRSYWSNPRGAGGRYRGIRGVVEGTVPWQNLTWVLAYARLRPPTPALSS